MHKFLHVHSRPRPPLDEDCENEEEIEEDEAEAEEGAEAEADEVPPCEEEEFAADAAEAEEAEEVEEGAPEPGADTVEENWEGHLMGGVEEEELPSDNEQLYFKLKEHEGFAAKCRWTLRERGCGEYYLNEKNTNTRRDGVYGKAAEVIDLCHRGTFEELAEFAFSKKGKQFAEEAAWRTQTYVAKNQKGHDRQRWYNKKW